MPMKFYVPENEELRLKIGAITVDLESTVLLCREIAELSMRVRVLRLKVNPDPKRWGLNPNPPTAWLMAISGSVYILGQENVNLEGASDSSGPKTIAALLVGYEAIKRSEAIERSEEDPDRLTDLVNAALPRDEEEAEELVAGDKEEEGYVESSKLEVDPDGDVVAEDTTSYFDTTIPVKEKEEAPAPPPPAPPRKGPGKGKGKGKK